MPGEITAIVLAAGLSRRMGAPKLVLPWGNRTVISQVVGVLQEAGVRDVIAVTGGAEDRVRQALQGQRVHFVHNPQFSEGEMLSSVQTGLAAALSGEAEAALIVLGDQPQIQAEVVRQLRQCWDDHQTEIIIPSYQMRRGHPWLVARSLWTDILSLPPEKSLRSFLNARISSICYLPVETESVLKDLDTPEEYEQQRPQ